MARRERQDEHIAYDALIDVCVQGGCPICTLTLAATDRYLRAILYEHVNDPTTRDALVAARGYCNDHAWRLRALGGGLGAALIYRDIVRRVAAELAPRPEGGVPALFGGTSRTRGLRGRLGRLIRPTKGTKSGAEPRRVCPACRERDRYQLLYLGALLDRVRDERLAGAVRGAGGLCLTHLQQAGRATGDGDALERLFALERLCLGDLHGALDEFIRKHDYRFSAEGMGEEGDAWIRAIAFAAGKPGIR